jgi:hypothetical protein
MPAPTKVKTNVSARRKLELSQIDPSTVYQELMGTDVGLDKLAVYLSGQIRFDVGDRITDASISRTMEGSTILKIIIDDYDRNVLTSGYLYNKLDVTIDGLWFRLTGVDKSGDELTLTFEDREIAVLRSYTSWKIARRSKVTRAEFILSMIREVKEFQIPVVIPELETVQPLQRYTNDTSGADAILYKNKGIAKDYKGAVYVTGDPHKSWIDVKTYQRLTVKNVPINQEQLTNANIILAVGEHMGASRKVQVCAIMTAIDESVLKNIDHGDRDSVGLFQQRDSWGSYEDRMNPETSSRMFYKPAMTADALYPHVSFNDLCQYVQHSGTPNAYGQYHDEADRIVTAHGTPGGAGGASEADASTVNGQNANLGAGGDYYFYRGTIENRLGQKIRKPENTWTCIQRLADDVNWKAFFVSGTFYFISEDDLIKQEPALVLNEWSDGVISIDGNFYENKKNAQLSVVADVGKWIVPPGRVVVIEDMGPWDGRWLVSQFDRGLFDLQATITLVRESPALPEPNPKGGNVKDVNPSWVPKPGKPSLPQVGTGPGAGADGSRSAVVAVAKRGIETNKSWHYHYPGDEGGGGGPSRPIPDSLWSADAHNALDCSAFATLCYKEAGCDDPNGNNYNGQGYTGTIASHGKTVTTPRPGDLCLYGSPPDYHHVTVYLGGGQVASCGSEQGIIQYALTYETVTLIKSFLP